MLRNRNISTQKERKSWKVTLILLPFYIVYFLVKGTAGYVIQRFNNTPYLFIDSGEHFGHVDYASDK